MNIVDHFIQKEAIARAVADWKAFKRHVAELEQDLADFREIFWHPQSPEQKSWALQMIKSIEHELDQLQA